MASLEELRDERLKKKALLEEKGIDPYPAVSSRTHTIKAFQDDFTALVESNKDITIVGRIIKEEGGELSVAENPFQPEKLTAVKAADIKAIVNESAEFAKNSPEPDLSELWTDIYA